jgi:hypothetical protein
MKRYLESKFGKLVCVCGWVGVEAGLLVAPNPFEERKVLKACPKCKRMAGFGIKCGWKRCKEKGTMGVIIGNRSWLMCHNHWAEVRLFQRKEME